MDDPIGGLRADVASIKATLPHLAAKGDLAESRAEVMALIERVDGNIAKTETSLIKWVVGSAIACTGMAFTAARLIS